MNVMILDAGNSIIKGKTATREIAFPHAIKALTETEYEQILLRAGRFGPSQDYLRVNGQPYVVGESAERHGTLTRRSGASRYRQDCYGILVAAALARLYERGGEVALFGSHPPGDVAFRNVILADDGQHYKRTDLNGGRALVIDIGGRTTDWLAVKPGGEVDYSLAESTPIGIQEVVTSFDHSFRANHRDAVRDTPTLPPTGSAMPLAAVCLWVVDELMTVKTRQQKRQACC